jgi:hypothetical protein
MATTAGKIAAAASLQSRISAVSFAAGVDTSKFAWDAVTQMESIDPGQTAPGEEKGRWCDVLLAVATTPTPTSGFAMSASAVQITNRNRRPKIFVRPMAIQNIKTQVVATAVHG